MSKQGSSHVVVIGGSMAGLLAARILSDAFDQVTVVERDKLPNAAEYRSGVPQARHLHLLLAHGEALLEEMFPGFGDQLEAAGAPHILWGQDTRFRTKGGWAPRFDGGFTSHVASRVTVEWVVRQNVNAIPNVTFLPEHEVDHLTCCDHKAVITGVSVKSRQDQSSCTIEADFVVDASGRGSKAPQWLDQMGYTLPEDTRVNSHLGYATRWYKIPEGKTYDWTTLAIQSLPDLGISRIGGAFIIENNQLVVTLAGVNKDYPPTDEQGFMDFAKSLASPIIYDVIQSLEPTSPIYGYRRTENRLRHFEKLQQMPERFIVMGDAACAFNPIYGQGMTTAALQANALRKLLQTQDPTEPGFSLQFQKELAKAVKQPWLMATGEDMNYPGTEGKKPNAIDRLVQRYIDAVFKAIPHSADLSRAFVRVQNLEAPATILFHPRFYGLLLKHGRTDATTALTESEFAPQHA